MDKEKLSLEFAKLVTTISMEQGSNVDFEPVMEYFLEAYDYASKYLSTTDD